MLLMLRHGACLSNVVKLLMQPAAVTQYLAGRSGQQDSQRGTEMALHPSMMKRRHSRPGHAHLRVQNARKLYH